MGALKEKLLEEIKKVPDEKLKEIYDLVNSVGRAATKRKNKKNVLLGTMFAGKWQDERTAEEIIEDLKKSRCSLKKNISLSM